MPSNVLELRMKLTLANDKGQTLELTRSVDIYLSNYNDKEIAEILKWHSDGCKDAVPACLEEDQGDDQSECMWQALQGTEYEPDTAFR